MTTKLKFQAIKGTRDLLPPETALWNRVEQTAHSVFATFGFGEIRLPIFEETELFARAVGGETDIVSKEMYSFEDTRGDLQEMRHMIGNYVLPVVDENWTTAFLNLLLKFQARLGAAVQSGEVEHNEEARRFNESFSQGIAHYQLALGQGIETNSLEIERTFRLLKLAVAGITLGPSVCLRPEATASVCRVYIEHNMQQLPQPVKLYYMGPMFRRERPQKGRYRQFYQIGAEVLGGPDASAIDAEVIEMVMAFFGKLELQGVQLDLNSIGCRECRPKYVELLRAELQKVKDKLGADSQRRIDTNPLRVLDSKLESEQAIIEKLPRINEHLCQECASHYTAVKRELDLRGVKYRENWRLVRGLDYYMRTTFEITAAGLGSQNAVCGGGRYDGLIELLSGPPTKGIGFAIGEDRVILSLQENEKAKATRVIEISGAATGKASVTGTLRNLGAPDVYIAWMGERAHATAIRAAKELRAAGFSVELPPAQQKFGKALGQADKLGARYALILGDNEVSSGEWTLKTLADGSQQKLTEPALLEFLRKQKAVSS